MYYGEALKRPAGKGKYNGIKRKKVSRYKMRNVSPYAMRIAKHKQRLNKVPASNQRRSSEKLEYSILNGEIGSKISIGMISEDPIFTAERWSGDVFPR